MESCQAMADKSVTVGTMLETIKMAENMVKEQFIFKLGTLVYCNDSTYVGAYKDGYKHGLGKLTKADGTVKEGVWVEDEFNGVYYEDL